jgi:cell division protein FtsZ
MPSLYLKMKEEPKQTGLFDMFAKAEEQDKEEPAEVSAF